MTQYDVKAVPITAELLYISERAYKISDTGDEDDAAVWLPKSQVDLDTKPIVGSVITFSIPEWLAHEKGLI